jgi:hypothetical protein
MTPWHGLAHNTASFEDSPCQWTPSTKARPRSNRCSSNSLTVLAFSIGSYQPSSKVIHSMPRL